MLCGASSHKGAIRGGQSLSPFPGYRVPAGVHHPVGRFRRMKILAVALENSLEIAWCTLKPRGEEKSDRAMGAPYDKQLLRSHEFW
jgi:hypothetical protein